MTYKGKCDNSTCVCRKKKKEKIVKINIEPILERILKENKELLEALDD